MPLDVPGCTRATMIVAVSISFIILLFAKFKFVAFQGSDISSGMLVNCEFRYLYSVKQKLSLLRK